MKLEDWMKFTANGFLLLDECHTYITENYREDILTPFDYFWKFDNKTVMSATPYMFSDKRFNDLHYHKIEFTESLGTVKLINAVSVTATLDYLLKNIEQYPGNVHIFYNSVTEIRNAIIRADLTDCNIYCANDKDGKNKKKLGSLTQHYIEQPTTCNYKKINFYTCKYFEGWGLFDSNATVVLVTDVHRPHTKVGVITKGKQAIGRLRDPAHQIIHITNHNHTKAMKSIDTLKTQYLNAAIELIKLNDQYISFCKNGDTKPIIDERLNKFADVNKVTAEAKLNINKLDQQVNEAANNESYNNIAFIKRDWKEAYFDVEMKYSDIKLETMTTTKRKSASKQLEEDYLSLQSFKQQQQDNKIFYLGETPQQEVMTRNPLAYEADNLLDPATMIALAYNVKKVQAAIINKRNSLAEIKLLRLINQQFRVGQKYTNRFIKSKLQEIYNSLNICDESGKVKVATANQLTDRGIFETKGCKITNKQGDPENGQTIERQQFNLRMAA